MQSSKKYPSIKLDFINTFGVPDIDLEIVHCIHHIRKGIEFSCSRDMSEYDLSIPQMDILASIMFKGSGTSTVLSKRLNVSKANLTGMISRLEKRELIKRHGSDTDGRLKIIELTDKGKDLINKVVPNFIKTMSEVLSEVPEEEKRSLVSNLALIIDSLTLNTNNKEG